jgi:hypothetical protein
MKNFEKFPSEETDSGAINWGKAYGKEIVANDPNNREEDMYQFSFGSNGVKVHRKEGGIFIDTKIKEGFYANVKKSQDAEIKNMCRKIDAEIQAHPKMTPQEAANKIAK